MPEKISKAVIRRLPKYHRYLKELMHGEITRISSRELSDLMGFTASQIRQDFNNFGGFGQQGYGYNVEALYSEISQILGLVDSYNTIIIGAGNLGQALANYPSFEKNGFHLKALFDKNPKLVGLSIRDTEIIDIEKMPEFLEKNNIDVAFVCTNKFSAQTVAEKAVRGGVKAIWNFAPVDLKLEDDVVIENVHLIEDLFTISYYLNGAKK